LANGDEKNKGKKGQAKESKADPKRDVVTGRRGQDYQLKRALDLLHGLSLFQRTAQPSPAKAPAVAAKAAQ